jgi:hypothetical protein
MSMPTIFRSSTRTVFALVLCC